MRYGTQLDRDDAGRLIRVLDRTGHVHAALAWRGDSLVEIDVGVRVLGAIERDPLLGDVHYIVAERGKHPPRGAPYPIVSSWPAAGMSMEYVCTVMTAVDWRMPVRIPTIAAPGKLPFGIGARLLNALALLADRPLRYAGPYPTPALYRALLRSFTTTATEDEFCAGMLDRAARVARDEIAIDFAPAPHERIAFARGHAELRDQLERVVIDGVAYETGVARLVDGHAEIWFGDAMYARVASFADDGALLDGPHPIPACTSDVIGKPFPTTLCAALAELVAETVPAVLAADVAALVEAMPMRWADLGARAARFAGDRFELHAALWDRIAPQGLARLALALAEALAPIAVAAVLARVELSSAP